MDLFSQILERKLAERLNTPVSLTITDNAISMLSIRPKKAEYIFRLHHMFLDADDDVLDDLAVYARTGRSAYIQKYIDSHKDWIKRENQPRKTRVRHKGEYYNLKILFDEVNREYFEGRVSCRITWGRQMKKKSRRSIRYGSYCFEDNLIRIHSRLDSGNVPLYFLKYIIYHEMLHADLGREKGRKHTGLFARREMEFKEYKTAIEWSGKHLGFFLKGR